MSIIAWIILGLAAGLLTSTLVPEARSRGPALLAITGMTGAILGGSASVLISPRSADGVLSPRTWPAAVAGAAVLLLARRILIGRHRETSRQAVTVPVRRSRPRR